MSIINRETVIKRMAATVQEEVKKAVERINHMLNESNDLPIKIREDGLGPSNKVRAEIMRQMRDAGWNVSIADNGMYEAK